MGGAMEGIVKVCCVTCWTPRMWLFSRLLDPVFCDVCKAEKRLVVMEDKTLRDTFAAAAMQGLLASEPWTHAPDYPVVARIAYMMAAAMLKHRRDNLE